MGEVYGKELDSIGHKVPRCPTQEVGQKEGGEDIVSGVETEEGRLGQDQEAEEPGEDLEVLQIGEIVYDARKAWPIQYRDQIVHWLAEGIPYHRLELLCNQREMEVPTRRQIAELTYRAKEEIAIIRDRWLERMWKEGLANKDIRLQAECSLAEMMKDYIWEGGEERSGRPKYQVRDYINTLRLIGEETGQLGNTGGGEDRRFQVLIQNIVHGTPNATIEVGAESRLLPAGGIQTDRAESLIGSPEHQPPISPRRRRRQRKVRDNGEGDGAARTVPAGDEGQ